MLAVFFCLENKSLCFFFLSGKRSKWAALCTSLTWKQPHPRPRKHHKQSPLQLLLPSPQVPKRSKKTKREVTHARLSQFTSQPTRKHHKPPPTLAAAARKCRRGKRKQRERVIQTHTLFVTIYISNAIPASAAATRARLKGGVKKCHAHPWQTSPFVRVRQEASITLLPVDIPSAPPQIRPNITAPDVMPTH